MALPEIKFHARRVKSHTFASPPPIYGLSTRRRIQPTGPQRRKPGETQRPQPRPAVMAPACLAAARTPGQLGRLPVARRPFAARLR